jgi:hypothetical protein
VVALGTFSGCADDAPFFIGSDVGSEVPTTEDCATGATQFCACNTEDTGAQVCAADSSAWSACDCATPPSVEGVSIAVFDADDAAAVGIVAAQIARETPCIQELGALLLTNTDDVDTIVAIASAQVLPQVVFIPAGDVTVGAGAFANVSIQFDCGLLRAFPPENIATSVAVSSGGSGIECPLQLSFSGF